MTNITHAAVGVIQRADGCVLLAKRPEKKPWAGWWEFPGGKIEKGETAKHALIRELKEEVGINATTLYPWLTRSFDYPEKKVILHFFRVTEWEGEPQSLEFQELVWQQPSFLTVSPMLPANVPISVALQLPHIYAISNMAEMGELAFMATLETQFKNGLNLIQVREKHLKSGHLEIFSEKIMAMAKSYQVKILINHDIAIAENIKADGVHLTSSQLMGLDYRPDLPLVAASCHNVNELKKAEALGCDFVVLSPVKATRSHPDLSGLGWAKFVEISRGYSLPIYALGGMQPADLETAWQHGAHGIAMQRHIWQ